MSVVISSLTAPAPSGHPFTSAGTRPKSAADSEHTQAHPSLQAGVGTPSPALEADALQKIVAEMQTQLAGANSDLEFSVDKDSGRSVVKVTERATKEVVWQFPSDQALQVSKELGRLLGAFVNRAA